MQLQLRVQQFVVDIDITTAVTIDGGPAVDCNWLRHNHSQRTCQRDEGLIGGLKAPLDDAQLSAHWEGAVRSLERNNVVRGHQLLVHVRVGLPGLRNATK